MEETNNILTEDHIKSSSKVMVTYIILIATVGLMNIFVSFMGDKLVIISRL